MRAGRGGGIFSGVWDPARRSGTAGLASGRAVTGRHEALGDRRGDGFPHGGLLLPCADGLLLVAAAVLRDAASRLPGVLRCAGGPARRSACRGLALHEGHLLVRLEIAVETAGGGLHDLHESREEGRAGEEGLPDRLCPWQALCRVQFLAVLLVRQVHLRRMWRKKMKKRRKRKRKRKRRSSGCAQQVSASGRPVYLSPHWRQEMVAVGRQQMLSRQILQRGLRSSWELQGGKQMAMKKKQGQRVVASKKAVEMKMMPKKSLLLIWLNSGCYFGWMLEEGPKCSEEKTVRDDRKSRGHHWEQQSESEKESEKGKERQGEKNWERWLERMERCEGYVQPEERSGLLAGQKPWVRESQSRAWRRALASEGPGQGEANRRRTRQRAGGDAAAAAGGWCSG